jgi:NAD(P)-dependent dehydrogenase (short-subunit alcohol dehydrogenase family)
MSEQKPVVLITGTSSGFGKLFVEKFARNGYCVFATMRGVDGKNAKSAKNLRTFADAKRTRNPCRRDGRSGSAVMEINKLTDQLQAQLFAGFGLADVTKQAASSSSATA